MDFANAMKVSIQGLTAESLRMRVAAENIANQSSVAGANGQPYRARQVYFKTVLNRQTGIMGVEVSKIAPDLKTPLTAKYEPGNPFADAQGIVQYPNVDPTVENINMRQAQRAYDANLAAIDIIRTMGQRTVDILR